MPDRDFRSSGLASNCSIVNVLVGPEVEGDLKIITLRTREIVGLHPQGHLNSVHSEEHTWRRRKPQSLILSRGLETQMEWVLHVHLSILCTFHITSPWQILFSSSRRENESQWKETSSWLSATGESGLA